MADWISKLQHKVYESGDTKTRRDFLKLLSQATSGYLVLPHFADLILAQNAEACQMPPAAATSLMPYYEIQCGGGNATWFAELAALGQDQQPIDYTVINSLGILPGTTPVMKPGNVYGYSDSSFFQGLEAGLDPALVPYLHIAPSFSPSQDDSDQLNISSANYIVNAGANGSRWAGVIATGGPSTNTQSRHGSIATVTGTSVATRAVSVASFLNPGNLTSGTSLSAAQKQALLRGAQSVTEAEKARLGRRDYLSEFHNFLKCTLGIGIDAILNPGANHDATQVPEIRTAFGDAAGVIANGDLLAAFYSWALFRSERAACVAIENRGGADYHDNLLEGDPNKRGTSFELSLGRRVRQIVTAAWLLGRSVHIHIISDGAVGANKAVTDLPRTWGGDRGTASGCVDIILAHPSQGAVAKVRQGAGYMDASHASSKSTFIGKSNDNLAIAGFLNWANASGLDMAAIRAALMKSGASNSRANEILSTAVIDSTVVFKKV